jgi:predicted AAA+ superfamily ATPase
VYLADSGLLHTLLDLETKVDLEGHPKVGASWEGFLLEQVIRHLGARREECYFWATHGSAELDLLVCRGSRRLGFEFKRSSAPDLSPSMQRAREDLELKEVVVVHAGTSSFPLAKWARAVAAADLLEELRPLR